MIEPNWIEKEDCLAFHSSLLARFGGAEGVRDDSMLDSALNRPIHLYSYGKPSHFEMAASYAYGVVKNHPFVDGNKRSGFMAAALFLEINGYALKAPEEEAVLNTVALAAGQMPESEYAAWLEASSVAV